MRKKEILWLYIFLFASLADISMIIHPEINYRYLTKPLIMISLMLYFLQSTKLIKGSLLRITVSAGLFFSFLGDTLLLNKDLFLYGLGAFFMTHVCYIIAFKLTQNQTLNLFKVNFIKMFVYNLPLYILTAFIYFLIHAQLNELKIPVIIYTMAIVMMVTMARERYGRTNSASFWQLFIGAFLFFISDSLLALDRFFYPIIDGDLYIMGTYILGQLLIIMGIRSHLLQVNKASN
ncbi:lysoplasmalogenase [Cyclobacterium marinum]|uniref:YhhN family protein n=1 Tax=Cyclobacterium marinum (strain ATCC 25205 / DSM 745 / LMG 13164 / NCIMB 1802) TaxID=880070 RepID=G0J0X0_CYCMS|nr:lysoplasmalogenase [Cyclobacterium marinum]AEL25096.1 YhhN family protein [Cyclobacterium marinum DSM 745]MBI0401433.1 lysoplasmalogenase [Cyclobacterium marinum]MBR9776205.1 lysoplasmalogenase [Cytophagales bacterium]|tara:strand:+ start:85729 stop:86430 length:702 start_codon:yes stop_codon:yes gene_type:complete